MTEIRVVAAVADTQKVVFYLENGETKTLKQTDPRLEKVMEIVIPLTTGGKVAIINLENYSVYREYEEKQESKGFVKFFKAAKSAVKGIFNKEENTPKTRKELLAPQAALPVPTLPNVAAVAEPKKETSFQKHEKHLKPIGDSEDLAPDETIVAVIGDMVIPEMEKLRPYLAHAIKNNSTKSVEAFLKRIIPNIEKRGHSIQDLMKFMEGGDMPIAEDGSIIAYKILKKTNEENIYVDKHTGNVRQKVGSYVCVNENLVDRNRSNECSNGLHIARRSYAAGFGYGNDVCVIIKLAPEDVVTVPHNDASKVRAMGYHIVGLLDEKGYALIMKNQPVTTDDKASNFIANVIKGNHIGRTQEVRIQSQMGGNVKYTDLVKPNKVVTDESLKAEAFDHSGVDTVKEGKPINPRDLNKRVNAEITKNTKSKVETVNNPPTEEGKKVIKKALEQAEPIKENPAQRAARLKREKRAAKKIADTKATKPVEKAKPAPKASKVSKIPTPKVTPKPSSKPASKATSKKPTVTKAKEATKASEPKKPMTNAEKARELYNAWSKDNNQTNLDALMALKKKSKISWEKLGLSPVQINNLTGK